MDPILRDDPGKKYQKVQKINFQRPKHLYVSNIQLVQNISFFVNNHLVAKSVNICILLFYNRRNVLNETI